jgi:hypothetical protein
MYVRADDIIPVSRIQHELHLTHNKEEIKKLLNRLEITSEIQIPSQGNKKFSSFLFMNLKYQMKYELETDISRSRAPNESFLFQSSTAINC